MTGQTKLLNKIYAIKPPYVSNGLKRSYNKHLEVFEFELSESTYKCVQRHFYKNKKWEIDQRLERKPYVSHSGNLKIHYNIIQKHTNGTVEWFAELEVAKASKFILVNNMAKEYKAQIEHLMTLFKKNVPDVQEEIELVKQNFPEYFI